MILDARDWAMSEFQGTPGLEKRLHDRLLRTAAGLADRPTAASLPPRFRWNELKAAYRLIDRAAKRPDDLQFVHRARTRERMAAARTVLVLHDTTTLSYTDHPAVADPLGPITASDEARGFLRHNSLAIDPDGCERLGLIHQQTFCREAKPDGETPSQRYQRAGRESDIGINGATAVGRMPDDACWVHVGDRGADFFGPMATCRSTNSHFLILLVQDRVVRSPSESPDESPPDDGRPSLIEQARAVLVTATTSAPARGVRRWPASHLRPRRWLAPRSRFGLTRKDWSC